MKPFVGAVQGGLFAGALSILIFFLKVICPINVGCLADPFLVVLFAPLKLVPLLGLGAVSYQSEPAVILLFWIIVGSILGYTLSPLFAEEKTD